MTDSAVDTMISDDLHELAALHGHPRVRPAHPFRAPAGTSSNLARRSIDLASAVFAWAPVYAHRAAWAVTGAAALITALLIADVVRDPRSVVEPAWTILGNLVLLATLYRVGHAIGRRRFERAARRSLVPGSAANDDAWALDAIARVDRWATSVTVAGLSTLLLAFGALLGGDARPGILDGLRVTVGHHMATTAAFGLVMAVALGVFAHRESRGLPRPRWARLLEHGTTAAIGVVLTGVALSLAPHHTAAVDRLLHVAEVGVVLVVSWAALRLRRRDLARARPASAASGR